MTDPATLAERLAPCLWCRGDDPPDFRTATITTDQTFSWAQCARCGVCGPSALREQPEKAASLWNEMARRLAPQAATLTAQAERIAGLEAALERVRTTARPAPEHEMPPRMGEIHGGISAADDYDGDSYSAGYRWGRQSACVDVRAALSRRALGGAP